MRQVLSISLPKKTTLEIKKAAKQKGFVSVSSYIKYLVDGDNDVISTAQLLRDVKEAEKEYAEGKSIQAPSLTEALKMYDGE
ncbi:MAG: hypothetical protein UV82_C0007G0091 [Candidatus Magasanikbacteria bacterium GW2011_GWD2_43_18]|uniref:Uncharacterized protein n=2 Tax=Patescibacteria group TaxID=1783273 RepID=A0A2M7U323_9BACT|nr:MAG: hypothetical protein UV18_C0010G0016 [Candidatus Magasanikbacteria bacterium GW2011_GWC2_42_27]KKS71419.1 MAG: hypothetical protein UV42_C0029G0012 [Candidatus Magasanikbacteria bacterium GW2011_GWE2_42_7]KKT04591.1 MAG: hypothetical protein UV82_C0007G0091 [Candidatus Magasanikbacteria bacterium GW2011_GWD2_43_18]KKT24449.1 MAG: hypothetical protein UW10_C0026G0016 [Candidatus Magasanikbacteria bacterium GW2011_GWA2_43_9]PIZ64604.1 MAG: hypothetical protein COY14_04370 [Candidatus Roiz